MSDDSDDEAFESALDEKQFLARFETKKNKRMGRKLY